MKVGFVGLGRMGEPMARNLRAAGHAVTVYNRTRATADAFARDGGAVAATPAEAARGADAVLTMVADDAAARAVTFGEDGVLAGLPQGSVHIVCATISAALAAQLAEAHHEAHRGYVSAPVFGRPEAAAAKKLRVVAAGAETAIASARPALEAIGDALLVAGDDPPLANVVKLAGNFMIAAMLETLGEAFALTEKAGVPRERFQEILAKTLFALPIFANYGAAVAAERWTPAGFRLALGLKDVKLGLEAAGAAEVPMPLASLLRDHFISAIARGYGDLDWAALARVLAEDAGIRRD